MIRITIDALSFVLMAAIVVILCHIYACLLHFFINILAEV